MLVFFVNIVDTRIDDGCVSGNRGRPDMQQLPEILLIGDVLHTLYTKPLLPWLREHEAPPVFDKRTPSCERGYVARWEIRDDVLRLTGLYASRDGEYMRVSDLFDGRQEVVADWFTGPLVVEPAGSAISDGAFPKPKILVVKAGRVVRTVASFDGPDTGKGQ